MDKFPMNQYRDRFSFASSYPGNCCPCCGLPSSGSSGGPTSSSSQGFLSASEERASVISALLASSSHLMTSTAAARGTSTATTAGGKRASFGAKRGNLTFFSYLDVGCISSNMCRPPSIKKLSITNFSSFSIGEGFSGPTPNASPSIDLNSAATAPSRSPPRDYLHLLQQQLDLLSSSKSASSSPAAHMSMEDLLKARDSLIQQIARCLLELQLINGQIDEQIHEGATELERFRQNAAAEAAAAEKQTTPSSIPKINISDVEEQLAGSEPKPLTADHKRFLRFKSYSYPFLTEDSWNNSDGFYDQVSVGGDEIGGFYGEPDFAEDHSDDAFEIVDAKNLWTNLLYAPETSFTDSTEEML